jgi:hypothetical protein
MRLPLHAAAALALVASVVLNSAFWGGVASSPTLGPVVVEPLRLQAPLAYTWLILGEAAGSALGMQESLGRFAEGQLQDPARIAEQRSLAVDRALEARSGWLKLLHPLPLILLPLSLLLWWRRPRGLKTFGGR